MHFLLSEITNINHKKVSFHWHTVVGLKLGSYTSTELTLNKLTSVRTVHIHFYDTMTGPTEYVIEKDVMCHGEI